MYHTYHTKSNIGAEKLFSQHKSFLQFFTPNIKEYFDHKHIKNPSKIFYHFLKALVRLYTHRTGD